MASWTDKIKQTRNLKYLLKSLFQNLLAKKLFRNKSVFTIEKLNLYQQVYIIIFL